MTTALYGEQHFDRRALPVDLKDLSTWPSVDFTHLPLNERELYQQRQQAVSLFVENPAMPVAAIAQESGVDRRQIYRLVDRCLSRHDDGRIFGFRALLAFKRVKAYQRIQRVASGAPKSRQGGRSGAFTQLLERYPALDEYLRQQAKQRTKPSAGIREVQRCNKRIHKRFLEHCRQLGIKADEYPFNQDMLGMRSLEAYLKKLTTATFADAVTEAGGDRANAAWPSLERDTKAPIVKPFEAVEFDGHRIDLRLTLAVNDPFGLETLIELSRIWLLPVEDVATRAVLGYYLALGQEYNQDDVAEAIQAALVPHTRRQLSIPGLAYSDRGGFPSEVFPELAYACWGIFRFDNAKAHLADRTLRILSELVGCWPDAGPPADPNQRPFIERFFGLLAEHFAHHIPGTTGSNPADIRRKLGDPQGNIKLLIRLEELEDLIDVLLSNYNGEPHGGLGGRSPLEALRHHLQKHQGFIQTLAQAQRQNLCLLQDGILVTVRGSLHHGVRPHVNFAGVRYSSEALSGNPGLLGKKLWFYYSRKDLRTAKVYFEDGEEFGVLYAARPWSTTQHSLKQRREILRLRKLGQLRYDEGEDPMDAYLQYKRKSATQNKRAASEYAKAHRLAQETAVHKPDTAAPDLPGEQNLTQPGRPDDQGRGGQVHGAEPAVKPLHIRKTIHF